MLRKHIIVLNPWSSGKCLFLGLRDVGCLRKAQGMVILAYRSVLAMGSLFMAKEAVDGKVLNPPVSVFDRKMYSPASKPSPQRNTTCSKVGSVRTLTFSSSEASYGPEARP